VTTLPTQNQTWCPPLLKLNFELEAIVPSPCPLTLGDDGFVPPIDRHNQAMHLACRSGEVLTPRIEKTVSISNYQRIITSVCNQVVRQKNESILFLLLGMLNS
jgi:hypothetical protein